MSNAYAADFTLTPTATATAASAGPSTGATAWQSSIGANVYSLQLHLESGTATVVLEGCNILHQATATTPSVILTCAGTAGDTYASTTTPVCYKYIRLRCSAYSAGVGVAGVLGCR